MIEHQFAIPNSFQSTLERWFNVLVVSHIISIKFAKNTLIRNINNLYLHVLKAFGNNDKKKQIGDYKCVTKFPEIGSSGYFKKI